MAKGDEPQAVDKKGLLMGAMAALKAAFGTDAAVKTAMTSSISRASESIDKMAEELERIQKSEPLQADNIDEAIKQITGTT